MKTFITDDFLLKNKFAKRLYHDYAKNMPIIDYHCHLSTKEIAEDKHYRSITEMWLDEDHYKWRAIRSAGYCEEDITGHIGDPYYDKTRFDVWANVIPQTLGNPLYHWTHLELLRYFNIKELLTPDTATKIYDKTNKKISEPDFSARSLIQKFQVKFIGTTDDPIDTLEYHEIIAKDNFSCQVTPSWRPDKIIKID
ncbi:MAG: glucuronate isomerase, partial [Brevinema sp.]